MQLSIVIIIAATLVATPVFAQPNNSRSGVPAETGTNVDILMDSTVDHKGVPRAEGTQPAVTTSNEKPAAKPVEETPEARDAAK